MPPTFPPTDEQLATIATAFAAFQSRLQDLEDRLAKVEADNAFLGAQNECLRATFDWSTGRCLVSLQTDSIATAIELSVDAASVAGPGVA